jgi:hypothetical protein
LKLQIVPRPAASITLQVTVLVPRPTAVPLGGLQVTSYGGVPPLAPGSE